MLLTLIVYVFLLGLVTDLTIKALITDRAADAQRRKREEKP